MSMRIEPAAEEKLVVTSRTDQVISRRKVLESEIMYMTISYEHLFCSHCNKIYIPRINTWLEIDQALRSGYVTQQLNVSCTLCDHCEEGLTFIAESLYVS
jgi:RNase P subunit RPR2